MLLSTDGTVTALLEACFGSPVVVDTIANEVDDGLDDRARAALLAGHEPIGTVLGRFDTRQLLSRADGEATAADELDLGVDPGGRVYARAYRIISAGRPLAIVTERIPASIFDPLEP